MWLDPQRYEMIDEKRATVLRTKSPDGKLAIVDRMWEIARRLIHDRLRESNPRWSEARLAEETAKSILRGEAEKFSKQVEHQAWEEILGQVADK